MTLLCIRREEGGRGGGGEKLYFEATPVVSGAACTCTVSRMVRWPHFRVILILMMGDLNSDIKGSFPLVCELTFYVLYMPQIDITSSEVILTRTLFL